VSEYATRHGLSRNAVQKRIRAGTLSAKQNTGGRWFVTDTTAPTAADGEAPAPDLALLKAKKTEAEIAKLKQQVAQGETAIVAKFWDDMLEAAAWIMAPMKQAVAGCGLTSDQRKALNLALRQVSRRLRERSKTLARRPAPL
jgi:hypothetical protein